MSGEALTSAAVDGRGFGGDRTHAVFDEFKGRPRRLTAREAPRLLAWRASYPEAPGADLDPAAPPLPTVHSPGDESFRWDDPKLPAALADDLGRPVRLSREVHGQQDVPETILVTVEATRRAVQDALGEELDLRRFRTNVHLELDAPPFAEEEWVGRRLAIGSAEFELLHPCVRCAIPTRDPDDQRKWPELLRWLTRERNGYFGINARPLRAGTLQVGETAEIA